MNFIAPRMIIMLGGRIVETIPENKSAVDAEHPIRASSSMPYRGWRSSGRLAEAPTMTKEARATNAERLVTNRITGLGTASLGHHHPDHRSRKSQGTDRRTRDARRMAPRVYSGNVRRLAIRVRKPHET